ncbi:MAG: efflux RND transporter periplasmic adaptor subunit [Flavobacteriales bacterium]|nr:efflux RND transporter periplasmic adaptor subunit [Flavobacteriales bacterium]
MKTLVPTILAALLIIGCAPATEDSSLAQLQAKKEDLKARYTVLADSIAWVDEQIALLDTTNKSPFVTLYEVGRADFDNYFWLQGNVQTDFNALVYPEINGAVRNIRVREGDRVSAGQVLIDLDVDVIRKNLAEVETNYELAVEVYDRQKNLWDQNIGSEVQFLEAKTRKESMERTMETLKSQIDMGYVKAPFSGVVDDIVPKIGEMANPMMPVARVVKLDDMYILADVPENYFGKVRSGDRVEVDLANADTLKASISRVGSYIKPENRTFEVRIDIKGETAGLAPNQMASMRVNDFHADSAVILPASMIMQDARDQYFVYVATPAGSEYEVIKTIVEPGLTYNGMTMVISGLKGGEMIVDKGARRVVNGGMVRA